MKHNETTHNTDETTKSKSIAIKMLLSYNNGVTLYHECYPQIIFLLCTVCFGGPAVVKLCDFVDRVQLYYDFIRIVGDIY